MRPSNSNFPSGGSAVALAALILLPGVAASAAGVGEPGCPEIRIGGSLPLPCSMPLADYEKVLYTWVNDREYARLGWARDRRVRDTGPFLFGSNYGTHPAVRIHYSPQVYDWLKAGRVGELPIGSMIVKEMFNPPAARLEERRSDFEDDPQGFERLVEESVTSWTIMIKDGRTWDGWFWAGPTLVSSYGKTASEVADEIAATVDTNDYPFPFRDSMWASSPCLRCHASAESELTFASPDNIDGRELRFRVDNSWRVAGTTPEPDPPQAPEQRPAGGLTEEMLFLNAFHGNSSAATATPDGRNLVALPLAEPSPEFVKHFRLNGPPPPASEAEVQAFPGQWADHAPAGPDGPDQFLTSDNCLGCHGGLGGNPYGLTMFVKTGPSYGDGYNVSPFGEWRWSPMGLAGRDPAFFAQVESELARLEQDFPDDPETLSAARNAVVNTCLSCHGGMGQRQLMIDAAAHPGGLDPNFRLAYVYAHTALTKERQTPLDRTHHKYGNLARDGIGCTLCHHIAEPPGYHAGKGGDAELAQFLFEYTTGQFPLTDPEVLVGPFEEVLAEPMLHSLGIEPEASSFLRDSKLCGTCHVINLPNVDKKESEHPQLDASAKAQADRLKRRYGVEYPEVLTAFPHSIEQATFLEWQNSSFATDAEAFQSCQDCHMPRSFTSLDGAVSIDPLASQIASIQDRAYPEAEHSLDPARLEVPVREEYRRHELVGLNVFLLEMFDQFDRILGIAETDYMTSATTGNRLAIENMVRQARDQTVRLAVDVVSAGDGELVADVTVTSKVGHRFPSGVAFRRAWIELLVLDRSRRGEIVWASGRTNGVGLLVDGQDRVLPTELFDGQTYQPHYDGTSAGSEGAATPAGCRPAFPPLGPITSPSQVQIYEEVTLDGDDRVTFSFIHRDEHCKDNRLLPLGWRPASSFGPPESVLYQFMEATDPVGVGDDADYAPADDFGGRDRVRYAVTLPEGADPADLEIRATMYYQAFQPYWMQRRFELSGDRPATRRLYYLASHLNTPGTVIEDWKLPLVSVSAKVPAEAGR